MTDTRRLKSFLKNYRRITSFCGSLFCALFIVLPAYAGILPDFLDGSYSDSTYHEVCNLDRINEKYSASACWSCDIIRMMTEGMSAVIVDIVGSTITLAEIILLWGSAVWLAVYFLKSVSAFAAQDPSKVLDGAITFMFKAGFIYVLIHNFGFEELVDKIVNPLLKIGMDIGSSFMTLLPGVS